ncbi:MAG: deoxyribose-phosphate aldolase [Thermotogae bacterium]|nr:deoxyribose-phosphate aldolase [Thermotogota bacterium]
MKMKEHIDVINTLFKRLNRNEPYELYDMNKWKGMPVNRVNEIIDHTQLKSFATRKDIEKLCDEAREYEIGAICINPYFVPLAKEKLKNTGVKIAAVIGFPLGATTLHVKVTEAKESVNNGADEVDMVLNIGALKAKEYEYVLDEIRAVVECSPVVKVIIETCYLTWEEKIEACIISKLAGASFVKTSTGFGTAGATVEDVRLMRTVVGEDMGVKAAGGIHDLDTTLKMIEAGASRIGASAGVKIVEEMKWR